jgi:hypothetical protein
MKFLAYEGLLTDILVLKCILGSSRHDINIPLFIYDCDLFVILILLTCDDQKVVRLKTYGTPCILWFKFFQNHRISFILSELASSDFCLFGYMKRYLKRNFYPSEEALLFGIHTILKYFHESLCRTCSGTRWTDYFVLPYTKVSTILNINLGLFIFVKFNLRTEVLHPCGTPYALTGFVQHSCMTLWVLLRQAVRQEHLSQN